MMCIGVVMPQTAIVINIARHSVIRFLRLASLRARQVLASDFARPAIRISSASRAHVNTLEWDASFGAAGSAQST